MNTIFKIAKTEIKTLFFSPIAWLILVIFCFQLSLIFTGVFERFVRSQSLGWSLYSATLNAFGGFQGLFTGAQKYLFLYIPLLTMGVISREFSSGSIKLLYASPVTTWQIVAGKYLSLIFFALALTAIMTVFGIYAAFTIVDVDIPVILTGLFGLFLLICAYCAIGLFMSSLTSYTVVSAMGTLAIFAILGYIKEVGQGVEVVRDITYWLAISGRSETFISGLITSEDLLYFLVVIALFLSFTVIHLQSRRVRNPWYITWSKYASVSVIAMLIGYFSAQPKLMSYYDVTRTKVNTLTKSSQEVLSRIKGGLTIHNYTNMLDENYWIALPESYKEDADRFKQYLRFNPRIKIKNTYYFHDTKNAQLDKQYPDLSAEQRIDTLTKMLNWKFKISSYKDISDKVNLEPEHFLFVRSLQLDNGRQTFLRIYNDMMRLPSETEITAAFKRLVMDKLPVVGFLTGHGERSSKGEEDRGYNMFAREKTFRYSLINQGFDFQDVTLKADIPSHIRILVIAELRKPITGEELAHLQRYIDKGGNLVIAGEPGVQQYMNPLLKSLGLRLLPGMLVQPSEKFQSNLLFQRPTQEAVNFSYYFDQMRERKMVLTMPTAGALEVIQNKGFKITTLFTSDTTKSWNELGTTDFIDDTAHYNPEMSELKKPYPTVLALSRKINNKEQKILVTGDADWLSNGELAMNRMDVKASNFSLINGGFFWLTDGEVPIDMRRDPMPDKALRIGQKGWNISSIALKWIFPILLIISGTLIWIRRKGR